MELLGWHHWAESTGLAIQVYCIETTGLEWLDWDFRIRATGWEFLGCNYSVGIIGLESLGWNYWVGIIGLE